MNYQTHLASADSLITPYAQVRTGFISMALEKNRKATPLAIRGLIDNFLEPAGLDFVDELVYRFLLTRGDSLGGSMRNLAGILAEQKLSRTIIATLSVQGKTFSWLDGRSRQWFPGKNQDTDLGYTLRGLHW
ncbi:MAG: hypothetical protein BroJett015_17620 [Chloroflexota bacterium]|nr:MAG: hypothetical protein BroJett015_17620 [Chloroflexota bacterium]